ncbi:altronate dehydratase family protein [Ahrensia marina]|uniref:UxaA family hydrolase n=1 Tax=Ahrensia marina TaxID=1514904 RepID=UPI0035CF0CBF
MSQLRALLLHPNDTVAVATEDLEMGADLASLNITTLDRVAQGHKISRVRHVAGDPVIRYGQMIGRATSPIEVGAHVHSHNLAMGDQADDGAIRLKAGETGAPTIQASKDLPTNFLGYHRADGRVGTRNYLGVVTSVNCSGSVARFIADAAEKSGLLDAFPNVDGIAPIVHGTGCGMAGDDEGYDTLFRTLSGYAQHPNFGGILLVGLGCEVMQVGDLIGQGRPRADGAFRYMTIQQSGGTVKTVERGVALLKELAEAANAVERKPASLSQLTLGLQCGGSDGYSGITANPALGYASDLLVASGGTSILSETPEIYGAEHLLTHRAVSPEVADKLMERVHWWERYTAMHGGKLDNNPSPGNKRGGLTTILEKSLGAVAKGGASPLVDVYKYAEPVTSHGLVYMDSPGYDPCSVTGQIASGANLVAFTTGRGSVSGYMPTPCIKLATNTPMYERMANDMDINCGDVLSDGVTAKEKGEAIFSQLVAVASGEQTKSEKQGFGGAEFVPWQLGAVM